MSLVDSRSPETAYATKGNIRYGLRLDHPNRESEIVEAEKMAASRQRDDEGNAVLSGVAGAAHTKTLKVRR